MDKKYIIGILIAIVIIIAGSAVFFGGQTHVERADDELVVAAYSHGGEPKTGFDPILGWNYLAEPLIQSTLLKTTKDLDYRNDLATGYTISDDLKKYTVNIRDDVNFTDGTPLTAEDVVFTYKTYKETGAGSHDLGNMKEVKAINDTAVEFTLNDSDSTFINKLTCIGIVPSDSYNNETYGSNPVGSGPFKFVQWDKGQQLILEKNPDYYGKQPEFNKLTILFAQNDAAFNAAKNGECDIAAVPLSYAKENISGMKMFLLDTIDVRGMSLPVLNDTGEKTEDGNPIGNNVTSDIAVRKALNYGINRTLLCEGALNGFGVPNYDGVAHQLPWANKETVIEDGDIELANKTLDDAGWKDSDGDGIREKNGTKASLGIYYSSDASERQAIAVSVSEQAKEMGIEINATGCSWDEIDKVKNSQLVVWGFGSSDPSTMKGEYYGPFAGQGYNNPGFTNISAVDEHIDNAMKMPYNDSFSEWSKVSWDGNTGIGPKGEATWLWAGEIKYGYFVDDSLDISEDTALLQPHGGDIFSNIYDWHRVSSIEDK
ncbi:oligopeptide-binding protein AppA precursor [Methanobrevibacter oralis]|uniref:Oligopeptide-binding protein AppA n=1 Tax=Methanobrevibacter oralis TaxID=66851 RepID=A0A162FPT2_METOA|nr:ABC transporter substrate-binding protein [Methanobrevibacter oralis]KZX13300.1 oligopeptide-binding protein AppA precursor [Methanobrevibacter oralis]